MNGALKSPVFTFIVGQALAFICWALLAAVAWGKLSQQFADDTKWHIEMEAWRQKVDDEGTKNFKYGHYEERLRAVEEATKKIDPILSGQSRIEDTLKEMARQKK